MTDDFIPNPPELDGVPDLSMLVYLEMEHVLHNLAFRYQKMSQKHCYTSVSSVLVAINPYERLPIYGQEVIDEFHAASKEGRTISGRPHPYGVSARSYMEMIQRKTNQSIVVCGESGAGKTETTKLLIRYLALTAASSNQENSMIEQQIVAASPILEAFGNAKTVLNNNSSRFGKFTKLLYDVPTGSRDGKILGSYLETYLLEKSRVVKQAKNERNYHIFYFLYHGLGEEEKASLGLIHPDNFVYSNQGECAEVPGVNDLDRYQELEESLGLMRIDEPLQRQLWRLTCGILHLGNVRFIRQDDGFAEIDPDTIHVIGTVADLWGITQEAMLARLLTATMTVGKKKIEKKITFDNAETNRDSVAKSLFENTFQWLCQRINAELYDIEDENDLTNLLFIGVLDVFGFENFVNNSLEQFCINFTNEKLQQFFNYHIIRSEQEEYIRESVFWTPLSVPDNLDLINFIENRQNGFFVILDSACQAPQPTVEAFMQELFQRHGENPSLSRATEPGGKKKKKRKKKKSHNTERFDGFGLQHFADHVVYNSDMFLIKNMEAIHPDTAKMFKKSNSQIIVQIGGGKKKKKKKVSVTGVFFKALSTLMKNLHATKPFFVRCVNPNKEKSNIKWHKHVVEHQLRCGGLVEALKVLKLGYPTRVPYQDLYDRYRGIVTNPLMEQMGPEAFSTAIMIAFGVEPADYELGLTKIFFKPAKAAVLETIMSHGGESLSDEQNTKITQWVVAKRIKQAIGISKTFVKWRLQIRFARAEKSWNHVGRVGSILGSTLLRSLRNAKEVILERKRKSGAIAMQNLYRGFDERIKFSSQLIHVKESVNTIWNAFHLWDERNRLSQWLDVKVEETRLRILEQERLRAEEKRRLEEKRREEERLRLEEEERRKKAELEAAAARKREQEEAEKLRLEEERAAALRRQEETRLKWAQAAALAAQERLEAQKAAREWEIRKNEELREIEEHFEREREKERQAEREKEHMLRFFSETLEEKEDDPFDEDEDDNESDDDEDEGEQEVDLTESDIDKFPEIARMGHIFLKYSRNKRHKPIERNIQVSFDPQRHDVPERISWGKGEKKFIAFENIRFIAWGHNTPVFEARQNDVNPALCLSVVGMSHVLDISASSPGVAKLWVVGLRRMLGQSEEESQRLMEAAINDRSIPGARMKTRRNLLVSSSTSAAPKYKVGDHVLLTKGRKGKIMFVGEVKFAPGMWYGVELYEQFIGRSNGTKDGVIYFVTGYNRGVFVQERSVGRMMKRRDIEEYKLWRQTSERNQLLSPRLMRSGTTPRIEETPLDYFGLGGFDEADDWNEADEQPRRSQTSLGSGMSDDIVLGLPPIFPPPLELKDEEEKETKTRSSIELNFYSSKENDSALIFIQKQPDLDLRSSLMDVYFNRDTKTLLETAIKDLQSFAAPKQHTVLTEDLLPRFQKLLST